jgi:enoyl-CoA hydratase
MAQEPEILFDFKGGIGFITLNRPQALNALTLNMIRLMTPQMRKWAVDPAVRAVVITGAGDRAFCSGGDVKGVAIEAKAMAEGKSDGQLCRDFFFEEYTLNNLIFAFPKPYIAIIDGIVMGGGKGLSAHGSHRVVTEKTLFAMPETNIGFFPDVGGGYFLPRCPGQTGAYLALTSKRIGVADVMYIGFGTHFVPSSKIPALVDALVAEDDVNAVIASFAETAPGGGEVEKYRGHIDPCFESETVEGVLHALGKDGSDWAHETIAAMKAMSPTSLKVALRQIRLGADMNFQEVMTMEYRLSQALVRRHDFYEGIRAALIDKDRQPKWNPADVREVSEDTVKSYFDSLGDNDLILS